MFFAPTCISVCFEDVFLGVFKFLCSFFFFFFFFCKSLFSLYEKTEIMEPEQVGISLPSPSRLSGK